MWGNNANNRLLIISLLISHGANVNRVNGGGFTPLHYASDVEVARLLFSRGAIVNEHSNRLGMIPLQTLVKYEQRDLLTQGHLYVLLSLIRLHVEHHADLRHKDKAGKSVLDYAKALRDSTARQKVSALLLSLGAK